MINVTNYQGNASENHNEISPHTCQDGYEGKKTEMTGFGEDVEKFLEALWTAGGNVRGCSCHGKQPGGCSKN